MTPIVPAILLHVILLVVASTSFTVLTAINGDRFQWQYFHYTSQTGWGHLYQFPYSLSLVLAYLAAYGTGLATYILVWKNGSQIIGITGIVLCALGFASFSYELTHWCTEFYGSWIAHAPGPLLLLAIAALIQTYRRKKAFFSLSK